MQACASVLQHAYALALVSSTVAILADCDSQLFSISKQSHVLSCQLDRWVNTDVSVCRLLRRMRSQWHVTWLIRS